MGQDLNEIPARREGQREPQDEGHEDFQAHLFSMTLPEETPVHMKQKPR